MPRVPIPSVSPQVGATPQLDATGVVPMRDFGAPQMRQLGQEVEGLGVRGIDVANQFQLDADHAAAKEVDALLSDADRRTMVDPEVGYLNKLGKAAVDGREQARQSLEQSRKSLESTLANDRQKRLFGALSARRLEVALAKIDGHASQQAEVYKVAQSEALAKSFLSDAVNSQDPQEFARNKGAMLREVGVGADARGASPAEREQMAKAATTALHSEMVQRLAQGSAEAAKDYLEKNKGEIDAAKFTDLQGHVQTATVKDESLRLAMEITAQLEDAAKGEVEMERLVQNRDPNRPMPSGEMRLETMLRDAQNLLDVRVKAGNLSTEVRDATMDRLKDEYNLRRTTIAGESQQLMTDAEAWLTANPFRGVMSLPTATLDGLRKRGLLGQINTFADNHRYTTEPAAVAEALSLPAETLRGMPPAELYVRYRGRLSDQDLGTLQAMHARANQAEKPQHTEILSAEERIAERAAQRGIIKRTGGKSEGQAEAFYRYRQDIQTRLRAFELTTLGGKRKASPEEVDKVIDQVDLDIAAVEVFGGDPRMPVGVMSPAQLTTAYVMVGAEQVLLGAIPTAQRAAIVERLQRRGLPASEQTIAELWVAAGKPK